MTLYISACSLLNRSTYKNKVKWEQKITQTTLLIITLYMTMPTHATDKVQSALKVKKRTGSALSLLILGFMNNLVFLWTQFSNWLKQFLLLFLFCFLSINTSSLFLFHF